LKLPDNYKRRDSILLRKENIQGRVEKTIDDPDEKEEIVSEKKQDPLKCEKKN
jgi:hypothetical protein